MICVGIELDYTVVGHYTVHVLCGSTYSTRELDAASCGGPGGCQAAEDAQAEDQAGQAASRGHEDGAGGCLRDGGVRGVGCVGGVPSVCFGKKTARWDWCWIGIVLVVVI